MRQLEVGSPRRGGDGTLYRLDACPGAQGGENARPLRSAVRAQEIKRAAERGFNLILDQYAAPEVIGERIALYRAEREASGRTFDPMQVAVGRQVYVAKNKADKEAALARLAKYTQRTVAVSRAPEGKPGSHVLAYADTAGGTEANALYGTADEICGKLHALNKAGVEYALLTISGGKEQLRRFARDIMPEFSRARSVAPELAPVST